MKITTVAPQSHQVAEIIRKQIQDGRIKPGQRLESVRSLAEKMSVGRQVVLSAFDVLSREGLLEKHVGKGTFVTEETGGSNDSLRIGFFVNKSRVEAFCNRNVFLGIAEKAGVMGANLLLAPNDDEFNLIEWCNRKRIGGLLITGRVDAELLKILESLNIPYVILGNYYLPANTNVVETVETQILCNALEASYNKFKFKSFGAILGPSDLKVSNSFAASIKMTLSKFPVSLKTGNIIYSDEEKGYSEAVKMFSKPEPPDAIYVTGEAFAGVARYLFEHNMTESCTKPIILTGGTDRFSLIFPELIDVAILSSSRKMGAAGVDGIIKLMNKEVTQFKEKISGSGYEFIN
jgi:DNA-binding transcriptional regulator YhcF (GntR family)